MLSSHAEDVAVDPDSDLDSEDLDAAGAIHCQYASPTLKTGPRDFFDDESEGSDDDESSDGSERSDDGFVIRSRPSPVGVDDLDLAELLTVDDKGVSKLERELERILALPDAHLVAAATSRDDRQAALIAKETQFKKTVRRPWGGRRK